ncbi:MAG: hypothetical protein ACI9N9_003027 [Enterobacterales bacterium]|jgi:hypothetical protein
MVYMKTLVLLITLILAGCASPPKTIGEFYTEKYIRQDLCSKHSVEETLSILYKKSVQCYQREITSIIPILTVGAGVYLNQGSYVEYRTLKDGTEQLALFGYANSNSFYQQLIEIKESESCSALVHVYEISPGWKKHTARVEGWLQGIEAESCGLW